MLFSIFFNNALTTTKTNDIIAYNKIRKAMTEKSSLLGSIQREQHLVEVVYVESRRKPFQSCNAEISKCYRIPALKDRIC